MNFVDFWSINRWLCQYDVVIEDGCHWVNESIIVHPLSKTPYHSTDIFKYWHPDKLHKYLQKLDEHTVGVCSFEQEWCPAFEFVLFPCPNGEFYAGYPLVNPKYYVRSFSFSTWGFKGRTQQERDEQYGIWWLERGQWEIGFTARRLWSCVLRNE